MSKLTPESQALAKKLAAEKAAPTVPANPEVDPATKPKPAGGGDATKVGGKALLPVIGEGKWASYHAVTEGKTFDVAVHGSGRLYLFLKDSEGVVIGKPLYLYFRAGYYTKPEARFGWPHAYYRDKPDSHYKLRKVVSYEPPSAPPTASGFRRLALVANHEDGLKVEISIEVTRTRISIWGAPVDPRKTEYPSVMALVGSVPSFFELTDEMRAEDWTPIVGDTTISVVPANAARAVDLPYLEKWDDLKRKGIYPSEIQKAELHGKLFGRRKVSLSPMSYRDLRFNLTHYSGIFPFQPYHFIYKDIRNGGKIDSSRRLQIDIR